MQVQVNTIQNKMAYRIDYVNFSPDGNAYVGFVLGMLIDKGENVPPSFEPVATQSFTLTADDIATMTIAPSDDDVLDFKSTMIAAIEAKLREKGVFKF